MTFEEILEHLEHPEMAHDPRRDISKLGVEISTHEAYKLQFALMKRRASKGDRHVGYQASLTSAGAMKAFPQYPAPYLGTLLRSNMKLDGDPLEFKFEEYMVETEIGVVFKKDLAGSDLTPMEVVAALEGYVGALEMAPLRPGTRESRWSSQQLIATHNTDSRIVLGSMLIPPTVDMRTEGAIVSVNGEFRASAAGIEGLGGPVNVLISLANILHAHDLGFEAGQVVITGSLPTPQSVKKGDRNVMVEFTRLGKIIVELQK